MSTARRLQFSLKHLLAAPVVLAIILGAFGWLGLGWGLFVLITAVAILAGTYGAKTRSEKTAICTIWVMLVIFLPLAIPSPRSGAERRGACQNNMKQIALALLMYESDHGRFPPPYIADNEGRPMHIAGGSSSCPTWNASMPINSTASTNRGTGPTTGRSEPSGSTSFSARATSLRTARAPPPTTWPLLAPAPFGVKKSLPPSTMSETAFPRQSSSSK